jgi:hypothetical protein
MLRPIVWFAKGARAHEAGDVTTVRVGGCRFWHEAAYFRGATIRPLSQVIRKPAERLSHRRL